jgi:hypothetical protein
MAAKTMKAVVAPRRTIWLDNKPYGPGAEVSLPADEVAQLRSSGFLVDPAAPDAPTVTDGPTFDSADPNATTVAES